VRWRWERKRRGELQLLLGCDVFLTRRALTTPGPRGGLRAGEKEQEGDNHVDRQSCPDNTATFIGGSCSSLARENKVGAAERDAKREKER
jgi:hypothetical protein